MFIEPSGLYGNKDIQSWGSVYQRVKPRWRLFWQMKGKIKEGLEQGTDLELGRRGRRSLPSPDRPRMHRSLSFQASL